MSPPSPAPATASWRLTVGSSTTARGAPFLGSLGGTRLNAPIVGMAVMPGGDGYYLVASDGGVFNYGSAHFYGSAGSLHLNEPVVGMAVTADGAGYWLVASDGGIFSYGDAQFYGSTGAMRLNKPIVGMAADARRQGLLPGRLRRGHLQLRRRRLLGLGGLLGPQQARGRHVGPGLGGLLPGGLRRGHLHVPTSTARPSTARRAPIKLNKPIVGMAAVAGGYYLVGSDGGIFAFPTTNGPPFLGSTGSIVLNAPIVGMAA